MRLLTLGKLSEMHEGLNVDYYKISHIKIKLTQFIQYSRGKTDLASINACFISSDMYTSLSISGAECAISDESFFSSSSLRSSFTHKISSPLTIGQ
mmetsp:Transcript_24275/g.50582  ORF Transcript_24275/g.50582 Transcript_24275/m.50582 type:complete len:96 (+) Transcript_24275:1922-2209(+)